MGKNTAWGNRAYKETIAKGGSKEQARDAQNKASEAYWEQSNRFTNSKNFDNDKSDFNNSANDGSWHTADDL